MNARLATSRDAAGQAIGARFAEEQRLFRLAPTPFAPEATTLATVTPRALVRLEGAFYSVSTRWTGLNLVVRVGASTVTITRRAANAQRIRPGGRALSRGTIRRPLRRGHGHSR